MYNSRRAAPQNGRSAGRGNKSSSSAPYDPYGNYRSYTKPNSVLSGLLYFLTILSLCFFIALMVLRSTGVAHIIRSTDVYGLLLSATDSEDYQYYIEHQINSLHFNEQELELFDVAVFIQRETVSNEIGGIVDEYATALVLGNLDHHVTTDDIIRVARNLEPDLNELFDHRMTDADYEHLAATLDDIMDFDSLSVSGLMEDLDMDLTIPFTIISPVLFWSVGGLCLLLLIIIFIIRKHNTAEASLAVGIPITISGLLAFLAGTLISAYPGVLCSAAQRFSNYLDRPVYLLTQYGFIFAAIGVLIIFVSFLFRVTQKNQTRHYKNYQ